MKKVTDFIINKRYMILVIFLTMTILCGILSTKVNINTDITKYLPDNSETRIGMNIMEKEFSEVDKNSSLNIMFKGLTEDEKTKIYDYLKNIEGVESLNHDTSPTYNKNDYTLYSININSASDSELAKNIYNKITEKYQDYEYYTSGSISASNAPILPNWILIVSVSCAAIILLFMCESYVEPFLFLLSILSAVILNLGSNIIFPSVSSITNSIAAILQMALSMDYSIMLMNRFREECEQENNKIEAMKKALYHSFSAISSSSVTTIVGLITLIFMSFTIGRDMGLVLAKGVLLSLVSIFLFLPTLILICDKLITKTHKKTLNIKLNILGKISNRLKYPLTIIFIIVIVGSYFLKGNLGILYTANEENKIEEVFGIENQIAIIYNNNMEEQIKELLEYLKTNPKINTLLSYSNTINEDLTYQDLSTKMQDLGTSMAIDDYLLKILYYRYYNPEINHKISLNELISFIEEEVYNNKDLDLIDNNTKNNINKIKKFTSNSEINKLRTPSEIANILELNPLDVEDILIYYNSKHTNHQFTINEFLNFLNQDVLPNPKYNTSFNNEILASIHKLETFTNENITKQVMSAKDLGILFNLKEEMITQILFLKYGNIATNKTLSLPEFINKVIYLNNTTSYLQGKDLSKLEQLSTFTSNKNNFLTTKMPKTNLANIFDSISPNLVNMVYTLAKLPEETLMTPVEFINFTVKNLPNNILDQTALTNLKLLQLIMNETINKNPKQYTSQELATILNLNNREVINLYALIDLTSGNTKNWTATPIEFINLILNNQNNPALKNKIDQTTLNSLILIRNIINNSNKKYNSTELSNLLNIDKTSISLLYGLYTSKYINGSNNLSLNTFINFILNDVLNNPNFSNAINSSSKTKLVALTNIMNSGTNNKKETPKGIYNLLSPLTNDFQESTLELLYIYYGSINNYNPEWKLTIEEFVQFLNEKIINDTHFNEFITEDIKEDIIKSKDTISDAKDLLIGDNYSRIVMKTNFEYENTETFNFIKDLKERIPNTLDYYIIGDSPMAYEINQTFLNEFNYISILTMIAIFVVVAITFKSIIIPIILVLLIQSAVYLTMGILSFTTGNVYFIALLIVQSILMGATIDYAILYTSYYLENRTTLNIKESIIHSYNSSIHTILTSSSILIIVTFIIGKFASGITSKICITIAEGTLCSAILILLLLPGVLATFDKLIIKKTKKQ